MRSDSELDGACWWWLLTGRGVWGCWSTRQGSCSRDVRMQELLGVKVRTSDGRVGGQSGQRVSLEWQLRGAGLARLARRDAQ